MLPPAYLINMDKELGRLKAFDEMMISHDGTVEWTYERMPAINGKDLHRGVQTVYRSEEEGLSHCSNTIIPEDAVSLKRKYIRDSNWLTSPEMGCLMSHVFLWEKVANDHNLDRIVIFEDDARTHLDVKTVAVLLEEFYTYLSDNGIEEPDMLYLGKALDSCIEYKKVWKNVYRTYHPLCLHAYIITKKGAKKLLEKIPYHHPIDFIPIFAARSNRIVAMTFHPSLYFQDVLNTTSSLRSLRDTISVTSECMVSNISEEDIPFISALITGLVLTVILYLIYMWS